MISLRNRKCVTDRKLNSLLMRTAFCRGGGESASNQNEAVCFALFFAACTSLSRHLLSSCSGERKVVGKIVLLTAFFRSLLLKTGYRILGQSMRLFL